MKILSGNASHLPDIFLPISGRGAQKMEKITRLLDEAAVRRSLMRIAHEIIEKNKGLEGVCLCGIRRRGASIADTLADALERIEGTRPPVGYLDITLYRDDLSPAAPAPRLNASELPFDVGGKTLVLCDDVIFTGRTVRAAIEAVFDLGRPSAIQLAVLIDRGHRELPIRPDFVGKNVPTSLSEIVSVRMPAEDGETAVDICRPEA